MLPSRLDAAYDHAVACLHAVRGDLALLPEPLQTLLIVESAQGMIECGGLAWFYEADFPNQTPYADFVAAYRRIGADAAADCIEATEQMFPFSEPHYFEDLRRLWLEKLTDDPTSEFERLSERIRMDDGVWELLAAYVERHRVAFTAP